MVLKGPNVMAESYRPALKIIANGAFGLSFGEASPNDACPWGFMSGAVE